MQPPRKIVHTVGHGWCLSNSLFKHNSTPSNASPPALRLHHRSPPPRPCLSPQADTVLLADCGFLTDVITSIAKDRGCTCEEWLTRMALPPTASKAGDAMLLNTTLPYNQWGDTALAAAVACLARCKVYIFEADVNNRPVFKTTLIPRGLAAPG